MINYINSNIKQLSVHFVGNKNNGEELILSDKPVDLSDNKIKDLLFKFFAPVFELNEYFQFTFSDGDFKLNPMYNYLTQLFNSKISFHKFSKNIAKHLFELSQHPQIKSGDLFVAQFSNLQVGDVIANGIGIFKSENRQPFLKLNLSKGSYVVNCDDGVDINKLDKGCLILETDKEEGYLVCIIDKTNKAEQAYFWKDQFLILSPIDDNFHRTIQFLDSTKRYISNQFKDKSEQVSLLDRSITYFKVNENFNINQFEEQVLQSPEIIKSFRKFNEVICNTFEISPIAVKKQTKYFKSVLKLDKNFHIYIHGDQNLIVKGIDNDGRKFYKIYFENES
jgi:hypothetical protein